MNIKAALRKSFEAMLPMIDDLRDKDNSPVDNVLIHIRCTGLALESRSMIWVDSIISLVVELFMVLIFGPLALVRLRVRGLLSIILCIVLWFFFQLELMTSIFASVLFFIVTNIKEASGWFQCFLFNLFDVFTAGTGTQLWVTYYLSQTTQHQSWCNRGITPLTQQINCGRHLINANSMRQIEIDFLDKAILYSSDPEKRNELVNAYWKSVTESMQ
jgi:hypothetical protein